MEHDRRRWITSGVERREERIEVGARHRSAQPAEAGQEHELELVHDRPRDAQEQIVEATVLEVILDACPTDPADPAIDDEQLAVVEVPERFRFQRIGPPASIGPDCARGLVARTTHTVTPAAGELLVEPARTLDRDRSRVRSMINRTGTPVAALAASASANASPTSPV